jgi:retinol-binding protein 3
VQFAPIGPKPHEHSYVPQGDEAARDNYAFRKVEVLDKNIGYLRLDLFLNQPDAFRTADAAMAFLRHVDALVFDLRYNGGGDPEMIRYLTSYLFASPTLLNTMMDRNGKIVEEFRTGDVPGAKFRPDLPVYVLTSAHTFSGAEEFAYNLKNLKRATVIGETTGGGAHPVQPIRVSDRFVIGVPYERAVNPITKANWEGVGVQPDVKVSADEALDKALELAHDAGKKRHSLPTS